MTLRVVIAEDSMLVREGIRQILGLDPEIEIVAVCVDLPEALEAVDKHNPDVLVTDVRMPPTNTDEGIQAAQELRTRSPKAGVVVLSQYAEPAYATPLLSGGSAGRAYLLKDRISEPGELAAAVRVVAAGGSVIDPIVVEALVADSTARKHSPLAALSPREREVLSEIATGKSNAAVGQKLFLTERAVEKHINALFAKLGLGGEKDLNRRVTAVLLYMSQSAGSGTS